jgi:subtilisin-like proprotein convertase family protein
MKKCLLLFLAQLLIVTFIFGQTYYGTGGFIKDDGTQTDFTINISDLSPDTLNQQHGLQQVCVNIIHTWITDLEIHLISPSGSNIMLTAQQGGDSDFYTQTCFTMDATQHILDGNSPYTGSFQPFTNIGIANNNTSGNGTWTLRFYDNYPYADGGELLDWNLTFGTDAHTPTPHHGTKLPIVVLNTDNRIIPNEPKIPGSISIIFDDTGEFNHYGDAAMFHSPLAIEVRGASSQGFPKKSYGFELQDEEGEDNAAELLGLPEEEDWILYAPYTDKTFMRDALTYQLGNDLLGYSPRTRAVEVYLNGDYQGVYWLEEKIKRDKNRVDIKKLNPADTIGDALTGGYILKVDRDDGEGTYFVSDYEGSYPDEEIRVVFEEPEGPDLHPSQKEYITHFFDSFESALYGDQFTDPSIGYRAYVDVHSLIDFFIISEFGHNVDAYRLSTFLYKDRDSEDPLMHLGPMWDFNLAFGNVDYCDCQLVEGWAYVNSTNCGNTPLWWPRLLEDPAFRNELNCRYRELRESELSNDRIESLITGMQSSLTSPSFNNYEKWPILGKYVWPNYFIGETYLDEVDYMKQWIIQRLEWMDDNMPGECIIIANEELKADQLSIYPNPAMDEVVLSNGGKPLSGKVYVSSISGHEIFFSSVEGIQPRLSVTVLPAGSYMLRYLGRDGTQAYERMVITD